MNKGTLKYRVNHQLPDLGWVDFDLDFSPMLPRFSPFFPTLVCQSRIRQWNSQNQSQPKPLVREMMARADVESLKLGNVWVFVQLIFCPRWPINQLNNNPNIA